MSELERRLEGVRARLSAGRDPLDEIGIVFEPIDGTAHAESWTRFAEAARAQRVPRDLVVYVHVPFCARLCSYCLLAARQAPARKHIEAYVRALRQEVAERGRALAGHPVSALHIGGGTPTLLDESELDGLLGDLALAFSRGPDFRTGIEGHPATTTPEKLEVLARHGVGRISLGVESFTPEVLRRVGRTDQTDERVARAVTGAHAAGLAVNVDLLAGLPGETLETFELSVLRALALEPESLSVNRFIMEKSALGSAGHQPSAEDTRLADEMLLLADSVIRQEHPPNEPWLPLAVAGYGTQYNLSARDRGYFQQDMIGPTSILALGHGGLGHVFAGYFHTAAGTPQSYVSALESGHAPGVLAAPLSLRFEMAFFVADRACRGELRPADFARMFGRRLDEAFGPELEWLTRAGLLVIRDTHWAKPCRRDFQVSHLLAFLLDTAGSEGAPSPAHLQQYRDVPDELPPSVLWCRIAMRADATNRRMAP